MENNIKSCIEDFLEERNADDRYTSFDYCYNYFYKNKELLVDVEKSCLVLCFYLASWGMFRGSSFILRKSAVYFKPLIEYIDKLVKNDQSLWDIDVDKYDDENIGKIVNACKEIKNCIIREGKHADKTLTGKIMLGVFGCIPTFDRYFCDTLKEETKGYQYQCGFTRIDEESLYAIKEFYEKHKPVIDFLAKETYTLDFKSGNKTKRRYTKAKIIDMYGFKYGLEKDKAKKNVQRGTK